MNQFDFITTAPVEAMSDEELDAVATALERIRSLFEGLPKGITLWDAALCKHARRDPVAVAFMQTQTVLS